MRIVLPALVLAAAALFGAPPATAAEETVTVTCTLNNPAYSGSCLVDETTSKLTPPRKACEPVLQCLNNPGCTKTYCNSTTVRRGWALVKADVKAPEKK